MALRRHWITGQAGVIASEPTGRAKQSHKFKIARPPSCPPLAGEAGEAGQAQASVGFNMADSEGDI